MSGDITDRLANLLNDHFSILQANYEDIFYLPDLRPSLRIVSGSPNLTIVSNPNVGSITFTVTDPDPEPEPEPEPLELDIDWGDDINVAGLRNIYMNLCEYENIDNNDYDLINNLLSKCKEEMCRIKAHKSTVRFKNYVMTHITEIVENINLQTGSDIEKLGIYDKKLMSFPGPYVWKVKQHDCSVFQTGFRTGFSESEVEIIYVNPVV